ncbi:hypothetical protein PVN21_22415, partial [Bacillus licheniformis]
ISFHPRISVCGGCDVVDGGGEGALEWITLLHRDDGRRERRSVGGLFLLIGADPQCEWLPEQIARDSHGFVLTGRAVPKSRWVGELPPENLATSAPGVFAVGDIRAGSMKRVAAAAGEGAGVVPLIHQWIETCSRS